MYFVSTILPKLYYLLSIQSVFHSGAGADPSLKSLASLAALRTLDTAVGEALHQERALLEDMLADYVAVRTELFEKKVRIYTKIIIDKI